MWLTSFFLKLGPDRVISEIEREVFRWMALLPVPVVLEVNTLQTTREGPTKSNWVDGLKDLTQILIRKTQRDSSPLRQKPP